MAGNDDALVRSMMRAVAALVPPATIRRAQRVDQAITDDGRPRLDRAYGPLRPENAGISDAVSVAVQTPDDVSAVTNLEDRLMDHGAAIAAMQPLTGAAAVDGRVALLARLAAASAAGGGTVRVTGDFGFTGVVEAPSGVNIWGEGSGKAAYGARFVGLDATAELRFGNLTAAGYGGLSGNFLVDGNGLATNPMTVGIVNARHFTNVFIANTAAGGAALTLAGTQNSLFTKVSLETLAGDGLVFDRGAASNGFDGLNIADCEGYAVKYVASGAALPLIGIAYSTLNRINDFIIEHQGASGGDGLIYHGVGSMNTLSGGVLSLAGVTAAKTLVKMAVDDVLLPSSHLIIDDLFWLGVQAHVTALDMDPGTTCLLEGSQVWAALLRRFYADDGCVIHNHAHETFAAVTSRFVSPTATAGAEGVIVRTRSVTPLEIDRPSAGDAALIVKNAGTDALTLDNTGVITTALLQLVGALGVKETAIFAFLVEKADGTDAFLVNTDTGLIAIPNGLSLVLYDDAYTDIKGIWSAATGDLSIWDGGKLKLSSDAGSTVTAEIDGTTGATTLKGVVTIDHDLIITSNALIRLLLDTAGASPALFTLPNGTGLSMFSGNFTGATFNVNGANGNVGIAGALSHQGSTAGFYNATPVTQRTLAAAATDPATTQTLVNSIRQALIDLGLGA